ncbi:hypothetical protein FQR65_LT20254 [Abscondita terminalis]|nr:hypothetical protein FQR65_LT20254 [Abscondita terminalis]
MIAQYRDSRTAKTRANREIALLSHVFNIAREWGLTTKDNPCVGDIRPKAASGDQRPGDASVELLGHSKENHRARLPTRCSPSP